MALAVSPGTTAGQGRSSPKIHPALEDPLLKELTPGRSPFVLERRDGRILARVRTSDPEALRQQASRLGVVVRAVVGDVASVEVPEKALTALSSLQGVISIKPTRAYHLDNDVSTLEIGADAAAATYGGTGRGVIVAVIDTGLDFHHMDFRKADGTSRVLAAWDQTDLSGGGTGCPAGITFGRCWTKADFDAALAGGPAVPFVDGHGHGTHVTGTAAGNGRATSNGVPSGTYAGVATEADLVIVKVFTATALFVGDLTAAYSWVRDRAFAAGEPFVINMSLGSDFGPHDGTDPDEISLDAILAPGMAGRAAAIAAGNSRGRGIHTEGTAAVGSGSLSAFQIPSYTPSSGANNDVITFDLWYEGSDNLTVSVIDPFGLVLATATKGSSSGLLCTSSGGVVVNATNAMDPDNLDSEVVITISDSSSCAIPTPPPSGRSMSLLVSGVVLPAGGHYHIWTDGGLGPGSLVSFSPAVESTLVGIPGTSLRATTAGSYVTRNCWPNADPNTGQTCFSSQIGPISNFSSNGPTRDGRLKPEVAAPGDRVLSSLSTNIAPPPLSQVASDGLHWSLRGTSMASPHVAGALAVVLQLNPTLDAVEARQMLIDGARADAFTGVVPNQLYGNGKLGVLTGAQAVLKLVEDLSADAAGRFTWTPEPHSSSYNVYRGNLPGSLPLSYGVCLDPGLIVSAFTDPETPAPGHGFFYLVTGMRNGIEGSLGFDSQGQERPNTSPCP